MANFSVVPAFFRMMLELQAQDRDFAIVFRTFGTDLAEVVAPEFNAFCQGSHPQFPSARFDGTGNSTDFVLKCPASCATVVRDQTGPQGIHLVLHTHPHDVPPGGGRCMH